MKPIVVLLLMLLVLPGAADAQRPQSRMSQRDRVMLERQIMQRFARQVAEELDLSADQRTRVEQWLIETNRRRRELAQETMGLRREMAEAVRSPDTPDAEFERLLDRLREVRRRELEQLQADEQELSQWLNPRERAHLFVGLGRFQERIRAIISERGPRPRR